MIITQTPLRISFAGGGTDISDYYNIDGGAVISTSIDQYIYVVIKERFDQKIRVGYTRTEMVDSVDKIEHELVRECLKLTGITNGVEIATMSDIPSEGSGLGSSSTVTVGLLLAMHTYKGELVTAHTLAEEACHVEIEILKKPIGKQDQYIAAFGGLRKIDFNADETVDPRSVAISEEQRRHFGDKLMLFFTGITRSADGILTEQKTNIPDRTLVLNTMKSQVAQIEECLVNDNVLGVGAILKAGWDMKKQMASTVSTGQIDHMYQRALDAGAIGGKIAGAGGGGFLLLFCPAGRQGAVREALSDLRELPFNLERDGAKVILNARR